MEHLLALTDRSAKPYPPRKGVFGAVLADVPRS